MFVYCVWAYDRYYPQGPIDLRAVYLDEDDAWNHARGISGYDYVEVSCVKAEREYKGAT